MQQLLHPPSWERSPSLVTLSEVSACCLLLKVFFGEVSPHSSCGSGTDDVAPCTDFLWFVNMGYTNRISLIAHWNYFTCRRISNLIYFGNQTHPHTHARQWIWLWFVCMCKFLQSWRQQDAADGPMLACCRFGADLDPDATERMCQRL